MPVTSPNEPPGVSPKDKTPMDTKTPTPATPDPFKAHLLALLSLHEHAAPRTAPLPRYTGPRDWQTDAILRQVEGLMALRPGMMAVPPSMQSSSSPPTPAPTPPATAMNGTNGTITSRRPPTPTPNLGELPPRSFAAASAGRSEGEFANDFASSAYDLSSNVASNPSSSLSSPHINNTDSSSSDETTDAHSRAGAGTPDSMASYTTAPDGGAFQPYHPHVQASYPRGAPSPLLRHRAAWTRWRSCGSGA
ncbi:hypothetical protein C8R43DRAFT_1048185 [Mycena crocata]|nr:hypothetical protein C8R43DRAFT_1048185 [Mycena crocata]